MWEALLAASSPPRSTRKSQANGTTHGFTGGSFGLNQRQADLVTSGQRRCGTRCLPGQAVGSEGSYQRGGNGQFRSDAHHGGFAQR